MSPTCILLLYYHYLITVMLFGVQPLTVMIERMHSKFVEAFNSLCFNSGGDTTQAQPFKFTNQCKNILHHICKVFLNIPEMLQVMLVAM